MKPVILIAIALGCGLVAAVGVYQQMNNAGATTQAEKVQVVVAKKEININEKLGEENVELVEWAQNQVPQGALSTLDELKDTYARARFYPGEAVLEEKIIDGTKSGKSIDVPKGYRVVSVKVSLDSSVSNLVEPGDRVDVIVVLRECGEDLALAKTILTAVRVYAVNSEITPSLDPEKAPEEARAVSLILKPDQIEKLMMATEMGTIKLSLRSPDDAEISDTKGCTFSDMLGKTEVADEVSDGKVVLNRGLAEQPPAQDPSQPYWSMVVQSPGNAVQYKWAAAHAVPQMEVLYSDGGGSNDDSTESADKADGGEVQDFDDLDDDVKVTDYSNADE